MTHKEESFSNDILNSLESRLKDIEDQISAEKIEHGVPRNGTLGKYNRLLTSMDINSGNFVKAEEHVRLAFEYLNKSFDEAVGIHNTDLKNNVMNGLVSEQNKCIAIFLRVMLSSSVFVPLNLIKEMHDQIQKIVVIRLIHRKSDLWLEVFKSIDKKMNHELVDFGEVEELIDFIQSEIIEKEALSHKEYTDLQWLAIKALQSSVKRNRVFANTDSKTALILSRLREKSALLLKDVGQLDGAAEDLAESYFFDLISKRNDEDFEGNILILEEQLAFLVKKVPRKAKFCTITLSKSYLHGYRIASDINKRLGYIKKSVAVTREGTPEYAKRLFPYLYITELMVWLTKYKTTKRLIDKIDKEHAEFLNSGLGSIDINTVDIISLYKDTISLLKGNLEDINTKVLRDIANLYNLKIVPNELILFQLISRGLAVESNLNLDNLYESGNVDLENIDQRLEQWLVNEEGSEIEVKLSGESLVKEIAATIVGMANTNGGRVIIGLVEKVYFDKCFPNEEISKYNIIANKFVQIGCKSFDNFRQRLSANLKSKAVISGIDLSTIYYPEIIHSGTTDVLAITIEPIWKKYNKLITLDGKVYGRYDNSTIEMKPDEIVQKAGL